MSRRRTIHARPVRVAKKGLATPMAEMPPIRRSPNPRNVDDVREMKPTCTALVIFGITGDLARKKIFFALYDLAKLGRLDVPVVGIARSDWNDLSLRRTAEEGIREASEGEGPVDEKALRMVLESLTYLRGDYPRLSCTKPSRLGWLVAGRFFATSLFLRRSLPTL